MCVCVCVCVYIYIYIYTHTHLYICIFICKKIFATGPKRERNVLKWIGPWRNLYFLKIYLFCSCIHVCFQLVAFIRNIYGTRPCEWGTQWDLNSLVFEVFSWLWVYIEVTPFFSFLWVCVPKSVYLKLVFDICVCVCVCVCVC